MKRIIQPFLFLGLFFLLSCEKGNEQPSQMFIKSVETEAAFFNRGLIRLDDGSIIVYGVAAEDIGIATNYGQTPSIITKFDRMGNQIWQKPLPEEVYEVWKGILLVNGDVVFFGLNSELSSVQIGLVRINSDGDIIQTKNFSNPTNSIFAGGAGNLSLASMDIEPLNNGGFALATRRQNSFALNNPNFRLRLMVFDGALNVLSDEFHDPENPEEKYGISTVELEPGSNGDFWVLAGTPLFTPGLSPDTHRISHAAVMHFDGQTYERLSVARFVSDPFYTPKTLAFNSSGNPIWSAPRQEDLGLGIELYNIRNQEFVSIGRTIELRETNQAGEILNSSEVSGFESRGYFHKGKRCDSGGFIFIGTSGISQNLSNPSLTKILLVRTDDQLNVQWVREISTNRAAFGIDVEEIGDNFLISGSSLSINEEFRMIFFKINGSGELKNQ